MKRKTYKCPNGCKLPPYKRIIQKKSGAFCFDYPDFSFCPKCGSLMPNALHRIEGFFKVYNIHPELESSLRLLYKSEYVSAVREASVTLENILQKKSGLDSHGFDLATRALSFEVDKKTNTIIKKPLIEINALESESDRNEQNGVRYMLMGYFQGPRNLYLHNNIGSGVSNALSIIIETSFLLQLIDGHSMNQRGHWIPSEYDVESIYSNMPSRFDRWRLKKIIKKRYGRRNKVGNKGE